MYDPVPEIGLLYDSVPAYGARADAAFYADEAARIQGPILELGCGTGRILLPIARAGGTIHGLDSSRVLQHLKTADEQLRLFGSVARHPAPGARFVFDVFNPHFGALTADRSAEKEEMPELRLPDGRRFRRAASVKKVRWVEQVSEVELVYYVTDAAGATRRYVQAFDMRWYLKAELESLLALAGFRPVAVYGSFDREPLFDDSPEQVWCAVRA